MSRVNFKALGASTLTALREAGLGKDFAPHETALAAAVEGFDDRLLSADESTSGDTEAFRTARKAWLTFVDDTMKDYVTPRLRKTEHYADFRRYSKSKLAELPHDQLLQSSKQVLALYTKYAAALRHEPLLAEAQASYQQLMQADTSRDVTGTTISQARVALEADWLALARALRRLKAQLELRFDDPAEVYRFFDFSKAYNSKRARKAAKPAAASAEA